MVPLSVLLASFPEVEGQWPFFRASILVYFFWDFPSPPCLLLCCLRFPFPQTPALLRPHVFLSSDDGALLGRYSGGRSDIPLFPFLSVR